MTTTEFLASDATRQALEKALPAYVAKQRWFGAKSRSIHTITIAHTLPVLETEAVLALIDVTYADAIAPDTYLLPLCATTTAHNAPSIIVKHENTTVFDAVYDPTVRTAILRMVQADTDTADYSAPITSRVASAEQSNTSVIFNDRLILKLFRKLNAGGENPDVEISRFLSTVAGYTHIPAYRGSLSAPDGSTLAFAQDFVPNHGDGWEWLTAQLTRLFAEPSTTAAGDDPTIAAAALLGTRTAELHLALAHPTDDPAFRAEAFTPNDLATDAARLQTQADSTFAALKDALGKLPPAITPDAAALLARRSVITEQAQALATASPFRFGRRIRIHGDFHLGQTLRTDTDFLLVDFEGEPAKPLDVRRRKQSPLRDVAGMLRSFSYAAATALPPSPDGDADARAAAWLQAASRAFLDAYNTAVEPNPELTPQPEHRDLLLRAFLLEKALYELLYELNNRPTWIPIPLRGILALLENAA